MTSHAPKGEKQSKDVSKRSNEAKSVIHENVPFKFTAPFQVSESVLNEKDKTHRNLNGTLLVATTSRNNIVYEADEIDNATFNGKPFTEDTTLTMSVNHTEDVTDNIGVWKPVKEDGKVDFTARVMETGKHPYILEMIDKGLIRYVSVEAIAKQLIEDGNVGRAVGLDITGMGLVKTPGIVEAHAALAEAFDKIKENGENMAEENEKKPEAEEKPEEKPEQKEEPKEEAPKAEGMVDKIVEKLDSIVAEKVEVKELSKKVEALEKKLAEKTKGQVTSEAQKPKYPKMVKEANRYWSGKKDLFADGFNY